MSQQRQRSIQGFTLVELVIVMTLVGVMAFVAVPSLTGLQGARQNVMLSRIRSTMVYAQKRAMSFNSDTWVVFDVTNELVTVFEEDADRPGKPHRLPLTDPLAGGPLKLRLGEDGVRLESAVFGGTAEVQFGQLGVALDGSGNALSEDGTVEITGGGALRVDKTTGLITLD